MINWVRAWVFNFIFIGFTVIALLFYGLLLPFPRRVMVGAVRFWAQGIIRLSRLIMGIDYVIEGRENLPDEPCIIAAKHQSAWDTVLFFDIFDDPTYVLKIELMKIPVYGPCARKCEAIGIDRSSGAAGLRKMIDDTRHALDQGRYVIIFPEGTRTDPGESTTYHSGVAALYRQLDVPVVPVALNSGNFWGRYQWVKTPGTVQVQFLEPIPPGVKPREMLKRLETGIEEACAALPNPKIKGGKSKVQASG
ncbi:MAG: lysophospholipid acyltransferase family protein [Magnetovibrionaceae bacterium]